MNIPFDTITRQDMVRDMVRQLKPADPKKPPPVDPPTDPNPKRHDVVAWRQDGARLDHTKHDTREAALAYGKALPWIIYHQWALMDGRDMLEKHHIAIPEGMAIDDNGMPIKSN